MEQITFPTSEQKKVLAVLNRQGAISTTRTAKEFHKFGQGKHYKFSTLRLEVFKIKTLKRLTEHPFYSQLTKQMKKSIKEGKKYSGNQYKVIWLRVINNLKN